MKKIITLVAVFILSLNVIFAADSLKMNASFSFSKTALCGFSKKPVSSAAAIPDEDKYTSADVLICNFNPDTNTYVSPLFYAYVQGFSSTALNVKLYAPIVMEDANQQKIPYTLDAVSDSLLWKTQSYEGVDSYYIEYIEPASSNYESRLVFLQPIRISVASSDVDFGKTYTVNFTLKVESVV